MYLCIYENKFVRTKRSLSSHSPPSLPPSLPETIKSGARTPPLPYFII